MTTPAPAATGHLLTISRYYDGCSTGDVDLMCATLADDVVHFFLTPNPGSAAVRGGEHLARYWRKVHRMIDAVWIVDHILDKDAEAVIEWTMFWTPPQTGRRVTTRGAEWFTFGEDGRITEIRSYYRQETGQDTELDGFPYADRAYSRHGAEHSSLHPGPAAEEARR
ncbi:MAG TPA: nuclear transport factor 2 family protein [Streptomyces sp.]|uniref:nuclear transport factor 2 family protein n=1 Tax=Streptomyces sp. TaxID=1931 RepID=UPI002D170112|nr:nuclear transport factor 2 family protein [Streptomyces sp.]HWU12308.1 nuclear transport factor 2 family protein [Streptomyces sp.]